MAEFYVTLDTNETKPNHEIHKSTCTDLPALNSLRYLGSFGSPEAALSKSRGFYDNNEYCSSCFSKSS